MAKVSNREKILSEGLRVVHERGFVGASVRDIIQAAGVPQGSFTNHFASKEAFALEVLDIYFEASRQIISNTLLNPAMAPRERLFAYIQANIDDVASAKFKNGCLLGNFSIESADHSELLRKRLSVIYREVEGSVAEALRSAMTSGDLPPSTDAVALAGFITASFQGSIMRARVERTVVPLEQFKQVLFNAILPGGFPVATPGSSAGLRPGARGAGSRGVAGAVPASARRERKAH
jgi:TetR/AcrR family transcriptional repressor of nem operon